MVFVVLSFVGRQRRLMDRVEFTIPWTRERQYERPMWRTWDRLFMAPSKAQHRRWLVIWNSRTVKAISVEETKFCPAKKQKSNECRFYRMGTSEKGNSCHFRHTSEQRLELSLKIPEEHRYARKPDWPQYTKANPKEESRKIWKTTSGTNT